MKQNKLVKISNVVEADQCIQYLLRRPKMEMGGLGLPEELHIPQAGVDDHSQGILHYAINRTLP